MFFTLVLSVLVSWLVSGRIDAWSVFLGSDFIALFWSLTPLLRPSQLPRVTASLGSLLFHKKGLRARQDTQWRYSPCEYFNKDLPVAAETDITPGGDVGVFTPTRFPVRGFIRHTFSTNALLQSLSLSGGSATSQLLPALLLFILSILLLPAPTFILTMKVW